MALVMTVVIAMPWSSDTATTAITAAAAATTTAITAAAAATAAITAAAAAANPYTPSILTLCNRRMTTIALLLRYAR